MTQHTQRTGGIILAGGQSRRMGQPKAWLPFAGELMLPRAVRLVSEVVRPIVVVAAVGQDLPTLPDGVTIVCDEEPGRGPLQGLAAGLAALSGLADAAFVTACDVPLLRPAFVRRLVDLLGDHAVAVPHLDGRYHPLAAVYHVDVLPIVRRLLAEDQRRVTALLSAVAVREVGAADVADVDPDLQSLRNLNTPAEYAAALQAAASK